MMKLLHAVALATAAAAQAQGALGKNTTTVVDPSNGASGAAVTLTQAGLEFTSTKILDPLLINYLDTLTLPEIDTEKDHIKIYIRDIHTDTFT